MKVGRVYEHRAELVFYQGQVQCDVYWTAWSLVKLDAEGMAKVVEFGMKKADEEHQQMCANAEQVVLDVITHEDSYHKTRMRHWQKLLDNIRKGNVEIKVVSEHEVFVP